MTGQPFRPFICRRDVNAIYDFKDLEDSFVTALGKLLRTTAFQLTLVYLVVFALFAAFLLGYFAFNTRRLINEQIASIVNDEVQQLQNVYYQAGIRRLPGASLRPAYSWNVRSSGKSTFVHPLRSSRGDRQPVFDVLEVEDPSKAK